MKIKLFENFNKKLIDDLLKFITIERDYRENKSYINQEIVDLLSFLSKDDVFEYFNLLDHINQEDLEDISENYDYYDFSYSISKDEFKLWIYYSSSNESDSSITLPLEIIENYEYIKNNFEEYKSKNKFGL